MTKTSHQIAAIPVPHANRCGIEAIEQSQATQSCQDSVCKQAERGRSDEGSPCKARATDRSSSLSNLNA
jgi:hypothetical protein